MTDSSEQQAQLSHALDNVVSLIEEDFGYTVHVGTEIEFYFFEGDAEHDNQVLALILQKCEQEEIIISNLTIEHGERQYEVALSPFNNAAAVCEQTLKLKDIIREIANTFNIRASFDAKPYPEQPGCGLHVHLHLENESRVNVFQKPASDNDNESPVLIHAVGGLLDTMLESVTYFAPKEEDYARFTSKFNYDIPEDKPLRRYNNVPTNVSWGSNNRTVAVRIPTSTRYPDQRHIEHRVASADADPYCVITAILGGIHHGLSHNIEPSEKVHGNAFDAQYERPALPSTLTEAQAMAAKHSIIKTYMQQ